MKKLTKKEKANLMLAYDNFDWIAASNLISDKSVNKIKIEKIIDFIIKEKYLPDQKNIYISVRNEDQQWTQYIKLKEFDQWYNLKAFW